MVDSLHFCGEGGLLVDGAHWLPEDPRDFHGGGIGLLVGCNTLRCDGCHHPVRERLGFDRLPAATPAALADLPDWSGLPEFRAGASARLYACGCTVRLVRHATPLELPPAALDFEEILPWRCAGHAPLTRPTTFAGLTLEAHPAWSALAATTLAKVGDPALHARVDTLAGFGAHRIYQALGQALGDTADRAAFSQAVAAHTIATPACLVAGTLFFALNPLAESFDVFAAYAARHLASFRGTPAGWGPEPTLDRYLINAMTVRLTVTPTGAAADAIRNALRTAATTAPGLGPWLDWYERLDRDWADAHRAAIIGPTP